MTEENNNFCDFVSLLWNISPIFQNATETDAEGLEKAYYLSKQNINTDPRPTTLFKLDIPNLALHWVEE